MKHKVTFKEQEYPDYPTGVRTVYTARCSLCRWFGESADLKKLEELADNHIYTKRVLGYPEQPPQLQRKS